MKRVLGIVMVFLAAMVGIVEFRAVADPVVAESVRTAFAAHDPFPRLPWDYHVIFILIFLGLSRVDCTSFLSARYMAHLASNQPMKPTAPFGCKLSVIATTPCRGLSLSR
jgi:hypothetical protein